MQTLTLAEGERLGERQPSHHEPSVAFEVHLLIEPFEEESLVLICFIKVMFHFQTNNWDDNRWPILACISAFSCKYLHKFISKIKIFNL